MSIIFLLGVMPNDSNTQAEREWIEEAKKASLVEVKPEVNKVEPEESDVKPDVFPKKQETASGKSDILCILC